uniref:Uncharacterized protein n=1 Tax=Meloidogyne enterolobii TaxID=390850 RepID=A0A6V7UZF4_MELEN|nr:unnamed protein product [Meloidogyne enterolobii]
MALRVLGCTLIFLLVLVLRIQLCILISNVLFLYAIYALSFMLESVINFIVLFTYTNPCDCLTQVWLVYLIKIPSYMYIVGSSLSHFAIMIERVLATFYVKIYEKKGKMFGVISTIIVWLLSLMYGLYIFITSQMDTDTFSHPIVYITLTNNYNFQTIIYLNFFLLILVICVAIADYYLIRRNQKIKLNFFKSTTNYSLNKSYQAKQNILLMKIIFPLDFSYSFIYTIFIISTNFIRYKREEYGQLVYIRAHEGLTLLIFIHAIITLIVYNYFLKKQNEIKKNFVKINMNISSEMYFKNLNLSWK